MIQIIWLASEPQGHICPHPNPRPSPEVLGMQVFGAVPRLLELNSCPHAYVTSTLPMESSPWILHLVMRQDQSLGPEMGHLG